MPEGNICHFIWVSSSWTFSPMFRKPLALSVSVEGRPTYYRRWSIFLCADDLSEGRLPLGSSRMDNGHWKNQGRIRGWELSDPSLNLQGEERGWRLSWSPMASDLINHANIMKLPKNSRGQGMESFQVAEHKEVPGGWCMQGGHGSCVLLPTCLALCTSSSASSVISFIINQ